MCERQAEGWRGRRHREKKGNGKNKEARARSGSRTGGKRPVVDSTVMGRGVSSRCEEGNMCKGDLRERGGP